MESIINLLFEHAGHAHWIIFGSLLLAGLNLPISEDFMIIISAILASNVIPENKYLLFSAVFFGAYLSDWMIYWIGRSLGLKLWQFKWFKKTFPKRKLSKTKLFYKKYGFFTLLIGRFIPFGVRNCLFFTAGLSRMPFGRFVISDGLACLISNLTLFYIAFTVGNNYQAVFAYLKKINLLIFGAFIVTIITLICYYKKKKQKSRC